VVKIDPEFKLLAIRPPGRPRDRAHLESATGQASKRFTAAVTDLAGVRRLQLPHVLVSITPLPPPPRVAQAEVIEAVGKTGTEEAPPAKEVGSSRRQPGKRGKGMRGQGGKTTCSTGR